MFLQQLVQLAVLWSVFLTGSGEVDMKNNLVYKWTPTRALTLDLYRPLSQDEPVPVVVIVHGGLWVWGHNRDYRDICVHLARRGIACAPINFRSFPPEGYTDQVEDIKDAIRWLRLNADALGLDPDRIGLFGSSSGGHLAGLAGFAGDGEWFSDDPPGTSSRVKSIFLLYGVYDLEPYVGRAFVRAYAGMPRSGYDSDRLALFSHKTYIDSTDPPTYIMHGTRDRLVPYAQALTFHEQLETKGIPVELHAIADGAHGFAKVKPWLRPIVFAAMWRFFSDSL